MQAIFLVSRKVSCCVTKVFLAPKRRPKINLKVEKGKFPKGNWSKADLLSQPSHYYICTIYLLRFEVSFSQFTSILLFFEFFYLVDFFLLRLC